MKRSDGVGYGNIIGRILLIVFDDSTRENEGNPLKVKLFRKFEGMTKILIKKRIFKRYELNELPMIILFNCDSPKHTFAQNICNSIIGTNNVPQIIVFR